MTGTGKLIRLILRRDRVLLPLWVIVPGRAPGRLRRHLQRRCSRPTPTGSSTPRSARDNAGFVALYGPLRGRQPRRAGRLAGRLRARDDRPVRPAHRHPAHPRRRGGGPHRADRRPRVVGRQAQLAAALITTAAAGLVLGAITAAVMIAQGLPAAGSVWFGVEFALSALGVRRVAAVTAQLDRQRPQRPGDRDHRARRWPTCCGSPATSPTLGSGTVSWLSWLSPIGWVQHIFPYGAETPGGRRCSRCCSRCSRPGSAWCCSAAATSAPGLFPGRPGPATAAPGLRSPLALAWRLHRGLLAGWVVGFAVLGLVFGGVGDSVVDLADDSAGLNDIFARMGGSAAPGGQPTSPRPPGSSASSPPATPCRPPCGCGTRRPTGHAEVVLGTPVEPARLGRQPPGLLAARAGRGAGRRRAGGRADLRADRRRRRRSATAASWPARWPSCPRSGCWRRSPC